MSRKVANRQIFDKGSLTNQLVSITQDLRDEYDLKPLIALVTSQLIADCAYYSPSSMGGVLCNSGEDNGKMVVQHACNKCIVGQFSVSGKFTGELIKLTYTGLEDSDIF